jgi:hypothetical protein
MIIGLKCLEPVRPGGDAMLRSLLLAAVLLLAACASPDLPEAYRSKSQPGAIDCMAYPLPPAPASCRNLYDDIIHRAQSRPIDAAGLF